MRALLASPLGFLIGVSLGALGGGGSILAVPALVYAAGQSPRPATTTSLVLVGVTALIGLLPHWRAGHVRWAAGTAFGLAGIGGSLLGSHLNRSADPDVLLLAFSGLMLVAAGAMWRRVRSARTRELNPEPAPETPITRQDAEAMGGAATAAATTVAVTWTPATAAPAPPSLWRRAPQVLLAGSVVGLLTGFFGVGGGFVIVPALVLALGFAMPDAVGTSLLVIAVNSAVALSTRIEAGAIEWGTVVPFTVASLLGVLAGSRLARTRDPAALQTWFVGLLVLVALYTAGRSVGALL